MCASLVKVYTRNMASTILLSIKYSSRSSVDGLDQNQKAGTIPVNCLQAAPCLEDAHPEAMSC